MALSTQTTSLQLVAGTLGSQARLQAGIEHLFTDGVGSNIQIALFRGPRPSQLEIDNHAFILEGTELRSSSLIGLWVLYGAWGTQVASRHSLFVGESDYATGRAGHTLPSDPMHLIPHGEQDFFHAVFPRHLSIGRSSTGNLTPFSQEGLVGGNGAAPTWGLVSLNSISVSDTRYLTQQYNYLNSLTLHTPAGSARPFTVLAPKQAFSHYITVGDWRDEPEANLTLYRGADKGQTTSPAAISPHRLRLRMTPVSTVPMGI